MSINETDETKLLFIIKFYDKPIIISVNIKNYSIVTNRVGTRKKIFNFIRI